MQLNVEGLSATKRQLIQTVADKHSVDVICLHETHIEVNTARRFTIAGFDFVNHALHPKHGRAMYVRSSVSSMTSLPSSSFSDSIQVGGFRIANIYKPPSESWVQTVQLPVLTHPAVYVGYFNSHHQDWGYGEADDNGELLQNWMSCDDMFLVHDSKQRGTLRSARWQCDYLPDLCWVSAINDTPNHPPAWSLKTFPIASIVHH
jgi:hypothetical protein